MWVQGGVRGGCSSRACGADPAAEGRKVPEGNGREAHPWSFADQEEETEAAAGAEGPRVSTRGETPQGGAVDAGGELLGWGLGSHPCAASPSKGLEGRPWLQGEGRGCGHRVR